MMKISSGKNQRTYPDEVDEVETIQYKRKKQKGRRQAILGQFRGEEMHHELDESACVCPDCLSQLKEIGSQVYRQEIVFIPAQLKRIDHIQHAYKCMACSAVEEQDKIIKAPVPKAPFKHSLGSASIIANSIEQKYNQKVPNYRQERYWNHLGLSITRKELSRWQNKASAIIMSLIETGNRHGLNSEKYFTYLLEHLPNEDKIFKKSTLEAYLPWSEKIQATCV